MASLRGLIVADPFSRGSEEDDPSNPLSRTKRYIYKVPGNIDLPLVEIPEMLKKVLRNNLKETSDMTETERNLAHFVNKLTKSKVLKAPFKDHLRNLKILVLIEQCQIELELNRQAPKNQRIKKSCNSFSPYFTIEVPGLVADDPFISIGDKVILNHQHHLKIINFENGKIEAKCKGTCSWFDENERYNVTFKRINNYTVRCTFYALQKISESPWIDNILHPVEQTPETLKVHSERQWNNLQARKNPEQKQAIENIIQKTASPAPYILFGPPGTGKTSTLVETIYQIYFSRKADKILVCTPSNSAADEITKRLVPSIPHTDILRLYTQTRKMELIDKSILPCANVDSRENKKTRTISRKSEMLEKRIIISTVMNSVKLTQLKLESSYFSYIFIDEAGQATEPETLIPLMLTTEKSTTQIVLAGDPMQLGPVIKSKLVEHLLGMSLMERLMTLSIYKKDRNNKYNPLYITKLVNNFRSHSAILKVPNKLFYDNELKACATNVHRAENWQYLPNKNVPVIFHGVDGPELNKEGNSSVYNLKEIEVIAKCVKEILASKKFDKSDIAVITPFRLQEEYIKKHLIQKKLSDIDVGTVQLFQGQEREVIILSTVRSRLFQYNGQIHIGFLDSQKRFNVSITRAKSLLIVIGNPHVLKFSDHWQTFLSYCLENKACRGEQFSLERSDADRKHFLRPPICVSDSSDDEEEILQDSEYRPQRGHWMTAFAKILEFGPRIETN